MAQPLVSVLTPTITGREWFLARCRNSVRAQTYRPVIHHIHNGDNYNSATEAFQATLSEAEGEYISPLSDDDWIAPHHTETLAKLLDEGADVAFAQTLIVNPTNSRLVDLGGAVMWRKTLTDRIGGFDTQWSHAGDTDLYSRFALSGAEIAYTPEPLYFFTEHATHGAFVHNDELAAELAEINKLYPGAMKKLEQVMAKDAPVPGTLYRPGSP